MKSSVKPMQFLIDRFEQKKLKNPAYSITAFARDLGLSVSFLSRLLRGQRPLTLNLAIQIGAILELSSEELREITENLASDSKNNQFQKKILHKKTNAIKPNMIEVEKFKAISQWYHFAILSMTFLDNFKPSTINIAKRLGISIVDAEEAIDRLITLGFLVRKNNTLVQTNRNIFVNTSYSDQAVREFHAQMIEKSKLELKNTSQDSFDSRYIAGNTMAIDREKLPVLREKIKKFQMELMDLAKSNQYNDVYHFNLQLFPILKS